jgi:hypothetical protein
VNLRLTSDTAICQVALGARHPISTACHCAEGVAWSWNGSRQASIGDWLRKSIRC